jgi:hypothetical protein
MTCACTSSRTQQARAHGANGFANEIGRDRGEPAAGGWLAEPVSQVPGGAQGSGVAGDGFGPRAVVAQQAGDAGGQGDDAGVLAGSGGVIQAGDQVGALGPGPGQGLLLAGQGGNRRRYRAGHRGGGSASLAGQECVGERGGVLVVVQQPGGGLVPVTIRVQADGEGAGMLADQVVQPVPAPGRLGQQVLVVQGSPGRLPSWASSPMRSETSPRLTSDRTSGRNRCFCEPSTRSP